MKKPNQFVIIAPRDGTWRVATTRWFSELKEAQVFGNAFVGKPYVIVHASVSKYQVSAINRWQEVQDKTEETLPFPF